MTGNAKQNDKIETYFGEISAKSCQNEIAIKLFPQISAKIAGRNS
jgi:hypothetical protein